MEIYLDNSATTRPCEAAAAALHDALSEHWYNPSALYRSAMDVEKRVNAVRELCLSAAQASGNTLVFTSGGTEADNLAILGYLRTVRQPGRVLITGVEHPAVSACIPEIERLGHRAESIAVTRDGIVDLAQLEAQLGEDVRMICVMQVNNESGAIMPIAEISALRDRFCPGAALHVDGVQGYLRVPVAFNKARIQSYAFSGHKIHAPKGIGGLIIRKAHRILPTMYGGGQESGYRSGTENTPGILALGAAIQAYPTDASAHMAACKQRLWYALSSKISAVALNGPAPASASSAPHILNVSFPPIRSQTMLNALEGVGILASAGSACGSHKQRVSPVLKAMGIPQQLAESTIRFSLCPMNTLEEMDQTAIEISHIYQSLAAYVRR